MQQPVPCVSHSDVERVVRRDFGDADAAGIWEVLDEYRSEAGDPSRMQLAVLKLAAGSLVALRRDIEAAKRDYRVVLAEAE